MKMEEQKLKTIQSLADLLRETTSKMLVHDRNTDDLDVTTYNTVFSKEEHETVKRKFLHLLQTL